MKKIETVEGFDIHFEAEKEHVNEREHFVTECGWTKEEYKQYKAQKGKWFSAHVEVRKAGIVLSDQYLGCCSYLTVKEFYTTYKNDYYAQMVDEGIAEAKLKLPKHIALAKKTLKELESAWQ